MKSTYLQVSSRDEAPSFQLPDKQTASGANLHTSIRLFHSFLLLLLFFPFHLHQGGVGLGMRSPQCYSGFYLLFFVPLVLCSEWIVSAWKSTNCEHLIPPHSTLKKHCWLIWCVRVTRCETAVLALRVCVCTCTSVFEVQTLSGHFIFKYIFFFRRLKCGWKVQIRKRGLVYAFSSNG